MLNTGKTSKGNVIHHMIEQQVMKKLANVSENFINNANRLKAIPQGIINDVVHLSKIRAMWDSMYVNLDLMLNRNIITNIQYVKALENFMPYTDEFIEASLKYANEVGEHLTKKELKEFTENWIKNNPIDSAIDSAIDKIF